MAKMKDSYSQPTYSSQESITAANYADRAMAYGRARGGFHSIRPDTAQWVAWMEYLDRLSYAVGFMRSLPCATVPTEWPEDFDPHCPTSQRHYTPPEKPVLGTPDRRKDIIAKMAAKIGFPKPEKRATEKEPNPTGAPDYSDAPLSTSEELRLRIEAQNRAKEARLP